MNANLAYRTLLHQGYSPESIRYLSSDLNLDLDGNPDTQDVFARATRDNLDAAITEWAADASNVVVYLVGPDADGIFQIGDTDTVDSTDLAFMLNALQASLIGHVMVVYDASESGSFLPVLAPPESSLRIVITSTFPGEPAFFLSGGTVSFSNHFWGSIFAGRNVLDAYEVARNAMGGEAGYQRPLLDDNGNGVGNEDEDGRLAETSRIVSETDTGDKPPTIGRILPAQGLAADESTLTLFAEDVSKAAGQAARVWAIITPPGAKSKSGAVLALPTVDLTPVAAGRFEAEYTAFDAEGQYQVDVYSLDANLNIGELRQTTVAKGLIPFIITGIVRDDNGPIANVEILLTTDGNRAALTNSDGLYQFADVPQGLHALETYAFGYDPVIKEAQVASGGGIFLDFRLERNGEEPPKVGCTSMGDGPVSSSIGDFAVIALAAAMLFAWRRRFASP